MWAWAIALAATLAGVLAIIDPDAAVIALLLVSTILTALLIVAAVVRTVDWFSRRWRQQPL